MTNHREHGGMVDPAVDIGTWIEPVQFNGKRYKVIGRDTSSKGVFLRSEGGKNRRYVAPLALALLWVYCSDQDDHEGEENAT